MTLEDEGIREDPGRSGGIVLRISWKVKACQNRNKWRRRIMGATG